jgi:hypothetical protein
MSPMREGGHSPYHRIIYSGESIFGYEYHREFAAKIAKALFGTDPNRNRITWETPSSEAIPSVESH